jgi:hypothetical protein
MVRDRQAQGLTDAKPCPSTQDDQRAVFLAYNLGYRFDLFQGEGHDQALLLPGQFDTHARAGGDLVVSYCGPVHLRRHPVMFWDGAQSQVCRQVLDPHLDLGSTHRSQRSLPEGGQDVVRQNPLDPDLRAGSPDLRRRPLLGRGAQQCQAVPGSM